jgi:hypothetical protein
MNYEVTVAKQRKPCHYRQPEGGTCQCRLVAVRDINEEESGRRSDVEESSVSPSVYVDMQEGSYTALISLHNVHFHVFLQCPNDSLIRLKDSFWYNFNQFG